MAEGPAGSEDPRCRPSPDDEPPHGLPRNLWARLPFSRDGCPALVPGDVVDVGTSSDLSEVDRLLADGSVETGSVRELVGSELLSCPSVQERIDELTVILTEARLISDVVEFTVERVAQVDLVPQRVAQLDAHKLAVPGSLHVLFAVAVGVRVGLEGELSPDGVFT